MREDRTNEVTLGGYTISYAPGDDVPKHPFLTYDHYGQGATRRSIEELEEFNYRLTQLLGRANMERRTSVLNPDLPLGGR